MTKNTTTQWKQDSDLPGYMLDAEGKFVAAFCSCGEDDTPSLPTEHEQACLTRSILAVNNHEQLKQAVLHLCGIAEEVKHWLRLLSPHLDANMRESLTTDRETLIERLHEGYEALGKLMADEVSLRRDTDNLRYSGKIVTE